MGQVDWLPVDSVTLEMSQHAGLLLQRKVCKFPTPAGSLQSVIYPLAVQRPEVPNQSEQPC